MASHDTATTTGTALLASSRACASAPWRGGSNTTASKPSSSAAINGRRNRSRVCASTGFRPRGIGRRALERLDRARLAVGGGHARPFGQPQGERADAAKQVGDAFGVADMLEHQPRQRRFAFGGRLQERAGRQRHLARARFS